MELQESICLPGVKWSTYSGCVQKNIRLKSCAVCCSNVGGTGVSKTNQSASSRSVQTGNVGLELKLCIVNFHAKSWSVDLENNNKCFITYLCSQLELLEPIGRLLLCCREGDKSSLRSARRSWALVISSVVYATLPAYSFLGPWPHLWRIAKQGKVPNLWRVDHWVLGRLIRVGWVWWERDLTLFVSWDKMKLRKMISGNKHKQVNQMNSKTLTILQNNSTPHSCRPQHKR